jgi:hypothetical protein
MALDKGGGKRDFASSNRKRKSRVEIDRGEPPTFYEGGFGSGIEALPPFRGAQGSRAIYEHAQSVLPGEPEEPLPWEDPNNQTPREKARILGGGESLLVSQTLFRRAEMWAMLASLPGASPETQALARVAQIAAGNHQTAPNPHSLKELEKKALAV